MIGFVARVGSLSNLAMTAIVRVVTCNDSIRAVLVPAIGIVLECHCDLQSLQVADLLVHIFVKVNGHGIFCVQAAPELRTLATTCSVPMSRALLDFAPAEETEICLATSTYDMVTAINKLNDDFTRRVRANLIVLAGLQALEITLSHLHFRTDIAIMINLGCLADDIRRTEAIETT